MEPAVRVVLSVTVTVMPVPRFVAAHPLASVTDERA